VAAAEAAEAAEAARLSELAVVEAALRAKPPAASSDEEVASRSKPSANAMTPSSDLGEVEEVLAFRVWKGLPQWRVRWQGDGEEETWEAWRVLDSDDARSRAAELRELSTELARGSHGAATGQAD